MEKRDITPRPKQSLLNPATLSARCKRSHFAPSPELAQFITVAWVLDWNLEEHEAFVQRVLPDPSVQIIVDPTGAQVFGVVTGAYEATITGKALVLGMKFRPAGFYPFIRQPLAQLTNKKVPIQELFPETRIDLIKDARCTMDSLEDLLRKTQPEVSPLLNTVFAITDRIASDSDVNTVEQLAAAFELSPRTLQRLFQKYVGVSPKWMIRRYRIQEAAALVEAGGTEDWSALAQRLGYFDQAHFINEFTSLVGQPPADYARSIHSSIDRRYRKTI